MRACCRILSGNPVSELHESPPCPSAGAWEFSQQPRFSGNITRLHASTVPLVGPQSQPSLPNTCESIASLQRKTNQEIACGNWKGSFKCWFWNAQHGDSSRRWRKPGRCRYKLEALLRPWNSTLEGVRFPGGYSISTGFWEAG